MKDPSHLYLIQFDSDIQYYTYEKNKNYEDVSSFIYEHLSTLCVILFNRWAATPSMAQYGLHRQ